MNLFFKPKDNYFIQKLNSLSFFEVWNNIPPIEMTDFLYEGYRKRCWKTLRESIEHQENYESLVKEMNDKKVSSNPEVQKFHSCLFMPLATPEIKSAFVECIKRNNGNIEKCPKSFENLKRKGLVELNSLANQDNFGILKTQAVQHNCELLIKKSKKLNCLGKPEQSECSEMKQQIFGCVIRTACEELHQLSNECFKIKKSEDESTIFGYFVHGQNMKTKIQTQKYCDSIQRNLMFCFEKFFLNSLIIDPDYRFKALFPKNLPLAGIHEVKKLHDGVNWSELEPNLHYVTEDENLKDE
jgi:hypothetical protein